MHFNNVKYPYNNKPIENKCNRIFRPWDSAKESEDVAQDSTVSTTTTEILKQNNTELPQEPPTIKEETGFRPVQKVEKPFQPLVPPDPLETYNMYPDVHANLVQSLRLTPNDPILIESMAQGFVLEEYVRVLNQEHQAKILASKKQRPKKYKCPHCDVGFSNNGQLKGHIRIHTGERPFKCDEKECGKTFTRNEELTRHKRIHSGLRPFPCTQCGKRFGRKDHLKKHSRTHFHPRGLYAVPVMLPFDAWASSSTYPFVPLF